MKKVVPGKAYIGREHEQTEEGLQGDVRRVIAVADGAVMFQTPACASPMFVEAVEFDAWMGPEVVTFMGRWVFA